MPIAIFPMLLLGLLSVALLFGSGFVIYEWWQGAAIATWLLVTSVAGLIVALCGRFIVLLFHRGGHDDPTWAHAADVARITRPDGAELHVEVSGEQSGPAVILVHGWGVDNRAYYYTKRSLSRDFRVIAWDLRGLGKSSRPRNADYSIDAMADDLDAVVDFAGGPAIVCGHSIGGMIVQNFARRHAHRLTSDVLALALIGTTYTDPTRTTFGARIMHALKRPVLTPLMYLTIALSPLVWAMNWLSYINGTEILSTALTGFAGSETRGQLDFCSLFFAKAPPGVLARGMLAMFRFDETSSLGSILVPVLVVPGDRDPVLLPRASERIAQTVRSGALVELPRAKHMGLVEHHESFNETLRDFIDTQVAVPVVRGETVMPRPARTSVAS